MDRVDVLVFNMESFLKEGTVIDLVTLMWILSGSVLFFGLATNRLGSSFYIKHQMVGLNHMLAGD